MNLKDFIDKCILPNTTVKLWKDTKEGYIELITCMEWEAREIKAINDIPVKGVTNIICLEESSAVNIVLDTDIARFWVQKSYYDLESKLKKRRENSAVIYTWHGCPHYYKDKGERYAGKHCNKNHLECEHYKS